MLITNSAINKPTKNFLIKLTFDNFLLSRKYNISETLKNIDRILFYKNLFLYKRYIGKFFSASFIKIKDINIENQNELFSRAYKEQQKGGCPAEKQKQLAIAFLLPKRLVFYVFDI